MVKTPTPKDVVFRDGTAELYRFRAPAEAPKAVGSSLPLLLIPSLINRWYVLDLRAGSTVAGSLVGAGIDTFCLDWGIAEDEDRYLSWEDVLGRLRRAARQVRKLTGAPKVGLLGYCMGGTLSGIHTAMFPDEIAALVNLAGPFDFSEGGLLRHMVDPPWFDAETIANAGNIDPSRMQSGFVAMRPTLQVSKWVSYLDRIHDAAAREAFDALDTWSNDNIPFPAAAYKTYIEELYQKNLLVAGEHRVSGRRVDLGAITCPVMSIVAERDTICPPKAATALNDRVSSNDRKVLSVPGGHVGAVVGSTASRVLYPALAAWLKERLSAPRVAAVA